MSKILLQTTVPAGDSDWQIGRFSILGQVLRDDGHEVVARDRTPQSDGSDSVLSALFESDFDELWLIAADAGNGLAPSDVRGILRFRERGGGMLTARDRQNFGVSLLNLGTLGAVNNFQTYNRERDRRRIAPEHREGPAVARGSERSANGGSYQRIVPLEPVHDILRTEKSPSGVIEFFPAHRHEGAISVPAGLEFARVIAQGTSVETGRSFNLAIAIEGEPGENGRPCGRAVAASTFRHFADTNWDSDPRAPSRLEIFKDYVRNIARWLSPAPLSRS